MPPFFTEKTGSNSSYFIGYFHDLMICSKSNKQQKVNAHCIRCKARYKVFRLGSFQGNILTWQGPRNPALFQAQVKSPPCPRLGAVDHTVNGHGYEHDRTCQNLSVVCSYGATGKRLRLLGGWSSSTQNPAPPPYRLGSEVGPLKGAGIQAKEVELGPQKMPVRLEVSRV